MFQDLSFEADLSVLDFDILQLYGYSFPGIDVFSWGELKVPSKTSEKRPFPIRLLRRYLWPILTSTIDIFYRIKYSFELLFLKSDSSQK